MASAKARRPGGPGAVDQHMGPSLLTSKGGGQIGEPDVGAQRRDGSFEGALIEQANVDWARSIRCCNLSGGVRRVEAKRRVVRSHRGDQAAQCRYCGAAWADTTRAMGQAARQVGETGHLSVGEKMRRRPRMPTPVRRARMGR